MTYWGYHLIFTLPLMAFLFYKVRHQLHTAHYVCWAITCIIVMAATTPWDNFAAAIGIWGFGEGVSLGYPFRDWSERTLLLGHIPFEEYAFFSIQTTMACLLAVWLMSKKQPAGGINSGSGRTCKVRQP